MKCSYYSNPPTTSKALFLECHCEYPKGVWQSDEVAARLVPAAITSYMDCFASLTMTTFIARFWPYMMATLIIIFAPIQVHADVYMYWAEGGSAYYTNVPGQGRWKVCLPLKKIKEKGEVKGQGAVLQTTSVNRGKIFEPVIVSASERFTVSPNLVRAVIKAESNFNEQAVSHKGAMGLMQLMPGTARDMGVNDPFDPVENIHGGVKYLKFLLGALDGDVTLSLAAYNAGPFRVLGYKRLPPIKETRDYVEKVLRYYREYNTVPFGR